MVFDVSMIFCEKKDAKTAITSNVVDCGADYVDPVDNGHKMAICINASGVAGTSLAFKVEDSADGTTFATVATSKAFTAAELADPMAIALPFEHRRYLRLVTVPTSVTAGTVTLGSATITSSENSNAWKDGISILKPPLLQLPAAAKAQ